MADDSTQEMADDASADGGLPPEPRCAGGTATAGRAPDEPGLHRLLAFLQEPVFVVGLDRRVLIANPGARALLGAEPTGSDLAEHLADEPAALDTYLRRCSGSGSPVIGALTPRGREDAQRLQVQGACFERSADGRPVSVVLRLRPGATSEFSVLARQVQELNREVRRRRSAQSALEEALRHKETLLRELHHRVKNHTQMLLGMLSLAAREAQVPELGDFIGRFRARLAAIGAAQQLMYSAENMEAVPARGFLEQLCRAVAQDWPPQTTLSCFADNIELRNDVAPSLALIVNELVANAYRHGLGPDGGRAAVTLERQGEQLTLSVWDSGGRWPEGAEAAETARRSSGLSLVRGLCRQLGGSLEVARGEGTRCLVSLPRPAVERSRP